MANAPLGTKNRPVRARLSLINGESSSSITAGQPVCFKVTDLSQVVLPVTAGVTQTHSLFAGIAATTAAAGQPVEIICAGYAPAAIFRLRTRAASSDAYSSMAASLMSYGNLLTIDTVNNCLAYSTIGAAALYPHIAVFCETLASLDSQASTTSITHTVSTTTAKVFVRALS